MQRWTDDHESRLTNNEDKNDDNNTQVVTLNEHSRAVP